MKKKNESERFFGNVNLAMEIVGLLFISLLLIVFLQKAGLWIAILFAVLWLFSKIKNVVL